MADPLTIGLMVASTAVSAIGSVAQGNAAAAAANYNAKVAVQQGNMAAANAYTEAEMKRRETARRIGQTAAAIGASGFTTQGTPLDVLSETAALGEIDAQTIVINGVNTARGYANDARLERMRGQNAQATGYLNAAGTLLGGAGKMAPSFGTPVTV